MGGSPGFLLALLDRSPLLLLSLLPASVLLEWQQRGIQQAPVLLMLLLFARAPLYHAQGGHVHMPPNEPAFSFPGLSTGEAGSVHLQAAAVQAERGSCREDLGAQQLPSLQRLAVHIQCEARGGAGMLAMGSWVRGSGVR